MAHSIKIEDKLWEKLRAYCTINGLSVTRVCNDAITDYLNMLKFGDTPFLIADKLIDERHATVQSVAIKSDTPDKNGRVYTEKALDDALIDYKDENGHFVMTHMSAEDGEKMLVKLLSENQDPVMTKEQIQKCKELLNDANYIVGIDTASGSDYTATVEEVIHKDGQFEIKKTTVEKPKKRRL